MTREEIPLDEETTTEEGRRVGAILRAMRVHAGLNGVELAAKAKSLGWQDLHNVQISRLEKGRVQSPSFYDILAIGESVGLSPNQMADQLYGIKLPETAGLSSDKKLTLWGLQRLFETLPEETTRVVQLTVDQLVAQLRK